MTNEPRVVARTACRSALVALTVLGLAFGANAGAATNADTAQRASQDTGYALVQLNGEPLATSAKTKPAQGKKVDFKSNAVKSYRAQLSALRNDYKAWLHANVPKAKITGQFDISLNAVAVQLNGASLGQVAASPLVKRAEYQGLYRPNPASTADPDLTLIRAPDAWTAGGGTPANAGEGIKVAILDTGIDKGHPCFNDAGYPLQTKLGDQTFTNNKVIVAKVFNNKSPSRHYTAEAIQDHGTHVAGTVACNYQTPATVNDVLIPGAMSGVAPRALLGNYNIFPADVEDARSEDILNALDAAYEDGFDVANMSLGGGAHGIQDLLTIAVDNLDLAGMVVAVANGNSGPGPRTVESPGSAARALSAGAASVGHQLVTLVTVKGIVKPFTGVKGDFGAVPSGGRTANLAVVLDPLSLYGGLSTACAPLPADTLLGKIALISRGTCDFSVKILNAQNAGAVAAIVVNRVDGDPFAMGQGTPPQPTIPAVMVALADRLALMGSGGLATTIPNLETYCYAAAKNDIIADFTSEGPTDVDFRVKPDVVAPGVNVLSSIPRSFCGAGALTCFAFFQGTSMATPHLAGTAAFLRGKHPDWSAADIRSAIVNNAVRGVLKLPDGTTPVNDVNVAGAGRVDVFNATNAVVAMSPVSLSFGAVPAGSGQTRTLAVTLRNLGTVPKTWSLAISATSGPSVTYAAPSSLVSLAAGASVTINVTMTAGKGAELGAHQAWLEVKEGGISIAHAALFTLIK